MSYKEGEVLVLFQEDVTEEVARGFINSLGLTSPARRWSDTLRMLLVIVPVGEEMQWTHELKKHRDMVKIADLNHIRHLSNR